jgi:hypothetical protein
VQIQVATTDIDNEGDRRARGGDVAEVLLGTDAEIRAAGGDGSNELGDDGLETALVGYQVFGMEHPVRLRPFRGKPPEFPIGEAGRNRRVPNAKVDPAPAKRQRDGKDGEHECKGAALHRRVIRNASISL